MLRRAIGHKSRGLPQWASLPQRVLWAPQVSGDSMSVNHNRRGA